MSNLSSKMDIVDVYKQLKKEFPDVEFVMVSSKRGLNKKSYWNFKLKRFKSTTFEEPIKTSITIEENIFIDEKEFSQIRKRMIESFYRQTPLFFTEEAEVSI